MSTMKVTGVGLELTTGETLGLDPDTDIVLTVLDGWDGGGTFKRASVSRLNGAGEFSERGYKGAKVLSVQGDAAFPTRLAAAQFVLELEATLAEGTEGRLTVNDEDLGITRWAEVYLTAGAKITRTGSDVEFTFDLMSPDPYKRADPVEVANTNGTVTVTNTGTANTELEFVVVGDFPNGFTITSGAGNQLRIPVAYNTAGKELTINAATGKVTCGSEDITKLLTTREWTTVPRGATETFTIDGSPLQFKVRVTQTWH